MRRDRPTRKQYDAKRPIMLGKTRRESRGNSLSRDIKRQAPTNLKNRKKQSTSQTPANQSKILALISMCDNEQFQNKSFEELWAKLIDLSKDVLNFNFIIPQPLNDEGKKLLGNGKFLRLWLKILALNPFLNFQVVLQNAYNQFKEILSSFAEQFNTYCQNLLIPTSTPQKQPKRVPLSSVKRSILKNSQKKVQFKEDEIIYPPLDPYPAPLTNFEDSKKLRMEKIRKDHGYLLDFFQINDIYFLDEVEFVGFVAEFEKKYAVLIMKSLGKDVLCIGVLEGLSGQAHSPDILRKIEQTYENLSFIDLQGKDPGNLIVETCP